MKKLMRFYQPLTYQKEQVIQKIRGYIGLAVNVKIYCWFFTKNRHKSAQKSTLDL